MKSSIAFLALSLVPLLASSDITVSTITPASGLTRGGELVHLHGTDLRQMIACVLPCPVTVKFGSADASIVYDLPSEMVVVAPPHAAGPVDVAIDIPGSGATTISNGYFYQDPQADDRVRLLVPVAISAAGASNSNWETDILVNNGNAESLVLDNAAGPGGDISHGVSPATIFPFSTASITLSPPLGNTGAFLYIARRLVDSVLVSVRVHDTTRDGDSWGTDIPVLPEGQFRPSLLLAGAPTDARFRTLLRVYGYNASNQEVTIRLRDDVTGELLDTRTIELFSGSLDVTNPPLAPAYGQLSLEGILAPFAALHRQVRVEIAASAPSGAPLWGFVAVTNNATEQVTTITPAIVTSAVSIPTPGTLAVGHWGGPDSCVDVTAAQVTLSLQCALDTFPYPSIGSDGRFEADGSVQSLSGPILPPVAAHFSGILQGSSLTLTIRVGTSVSSPITVQLGSPGACAGFSPCPISDDPLRKAR
jgi:hypothetical protein